MTIAVISVILADRKESLPPPPKKKKTKNKTKQKKQKTKQNKTWPLSYRCSALPTELLSQLGAGRFVRNVLMYLNNTLDTFCSKVASD